MLRHILSNTFLSTSSGRSSLVFLINRRNYVRKGKDPGINKRLKMFTDDFIANDPETFENMDSDFMNVHEAHKEFEQEEQRYKEKVSTMIVGRKYFKGEKGVNFLTWAEKEQIRMLHQQNPEEWTPETLSNSFPADPLTISKIIRNSWNPKDEKRIHKHDESARKNWQKFRAGEIEVEPVLQEHLKKFSNRNFNETSKSSVNRKLGTEIPQPTSTEFSSIITTCKKYSEENLQLPAESNDLVFPKHISNDPEKDSVLLQRSNANKSMKWLKLDEYQKLSPDIVIDKKVETPEEIKSEVRVQGKLENNLVSLKSDDKEVFKSLEIKEHIRIPKSVWKSGKTYKLGDCFYDDDGEFLYRVPGFK